MVCMVTLTSWSNSSRQRGVLSTCVILYRAFSKQGTSKNGWVITINGFKWLILDVLGVCNLRNTYIHAVYPNFAIRLNQQTNTDSLKHGYIQVGDQTNTYKSHALGHVLQFSTQSMDEQTLIDCAQVGSQSCSQQAVFSGRVDKDWNQVRVVPHVFKVLWKSEGSEGMTFFKGKRCLKETNIFTG